MSGVDRGAGGQQRHQYPDTDHRPRVGEMERHRLPEQVAVVESFRSTGPRYSGNSHAPEQSCFGGGAIAPRSRSVNRMQAGINSFEVSRGLETGMDNFGLSMERPQNSWDSRSSRHRDDTGAEVQGPACSMSQSLGGMRPVPAVQAFTAQGNEEGDDLTSGFLQLRQHLHSISKPLHAQRDHTPGNLSQAHHAAPAKTGPQNLVVQTVQGFKEYASPASNQAMNFLMGLESSTQQCNPVEEHVLELFQPSTSVRLGQSTAGILQDDPCSEFHGRLQPGPQGMTSATAAPTQCPTPHEIADTGYGHGRPLPVTTSSAHRGVKRPRQSLHRHVEPQQPRGFAEGRLEESHGFQDYEVQMPLGSGLNEATGQVSMSGEKRNRLHPAQPQATRIVTVQKRAKQTPQAQKEYPSWQQEGANASRVLRNQPPVDRQVKESEGVPKEMPGKHERIVFVPKHLPVSERLTRLPPGQSALSPTAADGPVRLPSGPLIAEMPGKRPPKRNKVTEDLRLLLAEKLKVRAIFGLARDGLIGV